MSYGYFTEIDIQVYCTDCGVLYRDACPRCRTEHFCEQIGVTARAALPLVPGAPWAVGTVGAAGRVCAGGRGQRGCTALYAFLILLFVVLQYRQG